MTVILKSLLGSDDDWIEGLRHYWWPRFKAIWPASTMTAHSKADVGIVPPPVEVLERELQEVGFVRNPIASLKDHPRRPQTSDGSWVILPVEDPTGKLQDHQQLHVTLFAHPDGGTELFGHVETDWRDDPIGHLENGYDLEQASEMVQYLLDQYTFVDSSDLDGNK